MSDLDYLNDLSAPIGSRPLSDVDYRLMVESSGDYGIFMIDINGLVRSWNLGARALKGYEAEDVIGRHFSMFYPQELKDRRWPEFELEQAKQIGRFEDEGWRLRKDGTRFWANIIITRLLGPSGELRGFSKITRDLSERRRQEELLRHSEERFRLLVDNVKDYAIFMLDPSGHVVSWNPGAETNTGYRAAEIVGQHFSVFYPQDAATGTGPEHELETALRTGRFQDEGWRVRRDGSRFWAGVVLTAVFDDSGRHRGFAKVTRDLTESRKVHALQDEGRRLTTFLAMLGHELRNPLAPMTNAMALLEHENLPAESIVKARGVIGRQLRQMTRLVDELLDVGRIIGGKINLDHKPVRIADVISEAAEAVDPAIRDKGHLLRIHGQPDDAWVSGDHARLVQIVSNVLGNAAKFTPRNGQIDVDVECLDGSVEIRIKDNGIGISEEVRDEIFGLFVQGQQDISRSYGGLGLGLALARQLVVLHGGQIEAYSKGVAGGGSEFVVRLPRMQSPSELDVSVEPAAKWVLVVDDNYDAADTLGLLMESLGYESRVVYDGAAALEMIRNHKPAVVLLDLGLPEISGLEVARRVETEIVDAPALIAISGYGQESDREATFKAGFYAHLSKPVNIEILKRLLKALL